MSELGPPDPSLRPFVDALRQTILEAHADAETTATPADDNEALEPPDELLPFVAAYRRQVSEWSGQPAPPRVGQSRAWVAPTMLAAAIVLLGFGVYVGLSASAQRADARNHGNASLAGQSTEGSHGRAPHRAVPRAMPSASPLRGEDDHGAEHESTGTLLERTAPDLEPPPTQPTVPRETSRPRGQTPSIREQLAQAKHAWRAGQLDRAERLFRHIATSPKASTAMREQAWADLFGLVRERDGRAAQGRQWRRYLEAHPRGRFADDLSAALCRRRPARTRHSCWGDYLGAYPRGQHRAEAQRELDRAGGGR